MKKEKPTPKPKKDKKPPVVQPLDGRPFPVPSSGCPNGWIDNGSGMCILDS